MFVADRQQRLTYEGGIRQLASPTDPAYYGLAKHEVWSASPALWSTSTMLAPSTSLRNSRPGRVRVKSRGNLAHRLRADSQVNSLNPSECRFPFRIWEPTQKDALAPISSILKPLLILRIQTAISPPRRGAPSNRLRELTGYGELANLHSVLTIQRASVRCSVRLTFVCTALNRDRCTPHILISSVPGHVRSTWATLYLVAVPPSLSSTTTPTSSLSHTTDPSASPAYASTMPSNKDLWVSLRTPKLFTLLI